MPLSTSVRLHMSICNLFNPKRHTFLINSKRQHYPNIIRFAMKLFTFSNGKWVANICVCIRALFYYWHRRDEPVEKRCRRTSIINPFEKLYAFHDKQQLNEWFCFGWSFFVFSHVSPIHCEHWTNVINLMIRHSLDSKRETLSTQYYFLLCAFVFFMTFKRNEKRHCDLYVVPIVWHLIERRKRKVVATTHTAKTQIKSNSTFCFVALLPSDVAFSKQ